MKELKPIDYKILFELMKDSHRSDRQLAKALGVSQPTVTRRRAMLEENYIEGYTVIPKFGQIGFEIIPGFSSKKATASEILISRTSKIFLPLYLTDNASSLNLFPWHSLHVVSIFRFPPSQIVSRPLPPHSEQAPFELNEK